MSETCRYRQVLLFLYYILIIKLADNMEYNAVKYDYYTGWPANVNRYLRISVGLYRIWYGRVKIGITNDPERRFK